MLPLFLGVLGSVAGGLVGGSLAVSIGYAVGSVIGTMLQPQRGPNVVGPRLEDLAIQVSSNVADLPRAYGTIAHKGNMIWAKGNQIQEVVSTSTAKKKFLGVTVAKQSTTTYSYFLTAAIAFVKVPEGATLKIVKVWAADKLLINNSTDNVQTMLVSGENASKYFTFYLGTDDQQPDPDIAADVGLANCSGYPAIMYVVIKDFPLADFFNSPSRLDLKVEYSMSFTEAGLTLISEAPVPTASNNLPAIHNANLLDGQGLHVWRVGPPDANFTVSSALQKTEFLLMPGNEVGAQLRSIAASASDINSGTDHIITAPYAAKGKSDRNVFVITAFVQREGGAPDGSANVPDRRFLTSQPTMLTLAGFWSTEMIIDSLWVGPYPNVKAALDAVRTEGGGPGDLSSQPTIDEYIFDFHNQLRNFTGQNELEWGDDIWQGEVGPPSHTIRFGIYFPSGTTTIWPMPITEAMFLDGNFAFWLRVEIYDAEIDQSRIVRIEVAPADETPEQMTHYAFYQNVLYLTYQHDGGLRRLVRIEDGVVTTTTTIGTDIGVSTMGVLNGELVVIFNDGADATIGRYDLASLAVIDTYTAGEVATLFGSSSSSFYNSVSIEPDQILFVLSGDLQTLASFTATAPVVIGDISADFIAGGAGRFFNIWQRANLYAIATQGGSLTNLGGQFYAGGTVQPGTVLLADIISAECQLAGLREIDIDVSLLTDQVRGYRITQRGSVRNPIQQLQACYPFDVLQSGYRLKFLPRGTTSVATVTVDDLGIDVQWRIDREMETQLPRKVVFLYLDRSLDYEVNDQYSERPIDSETEETIEIPIVFTADEAAQRVDVLHSIYLLERTTYGPFTLPPPFRFLEPSDVITVVTNDATYSVRLTDVEYKADGSIECMGKPNAVPIYSSNAVGAAPLPADEEIPIAGPVVTLLMDLPAITFELEPGITVAMSGLYDNWVGGEVWYTPDSGTTWQSVLGFADSVTMGICGAPIGAHAGHLVDLASELTVQLYSGTLASVTEEQFYDEALLFAYGVNGRWEIIAARTVVDNGNKNYTLSTFIRGMRGTEWATGLHADGDYLVWLKDPDLEFQSVPDAMIDTTITVRGANVGAGIDGQTDTSLLYQGVNLTPLSGVNPKATQAVNGNITITWDRRDRGDSSWESYGDIPMSEATESYEIDIMSGATVVRTLTGTTPSIVYGATEQIADFGTLQTTLTLRIYQLSALVGRGYVLSAVVPVEGVVPIPANDLLAWWDPSDLSTLWQDTAGTTPVTAAGQNVRRIDDKSGNGNHAIVTSGTAMTYEEAGGLAYIDFTSTVLQVTVAGSSSQTYLMACMALRHTSYANDVPYNLATAVSGTTRGLALQANSGNLIVYGSGGSINFGAHPVTVNNDYVATFWFDGAQASANDRARIRINAVDRARVSGSVPNTTSPAAALILTFPSLPGGSGGEVTGRLYGLAMYNVVLGGASLDQLEDYMAGKSGVTL